MNDRHKKIWEQMMINPFYEYYNKSKSDEITRIGRDYI